MTDQQLRQVLQSVMPPVDTSTAPADAWPRVSAGLGSRPAWTLADSALAAGIVTVLAMIPEALSLIALHL